MNRNKIDKATLISKIQQADGLTNEEKSSLMALLNEDKTYGLVWEDSPEEVEENLRSHIPVLHEVTERALTDGGADAPNHILIEGDNLDALTALSYTHEGKIDVIYIDPPYNTGNEDFVYNDKYVNTEDSYRHSKWLSLMSRRLYIAKRLLSDKGVIFISIDDNEQANLKLLCDEVLKGLDFVATIPWRKRTAKSDVPHGFSQDYEWILCYGKNDFLAGIEKETRKYYETPDFPGKPWRIHDLTKQTTAVERPNSYFTIVNPKNGQKFPANPNATWRITIDTFEDYCKNHRIVFPGDYSFLNISKPVLRYWKEDDEKKAGEMFGMVTASTDLPKEVGMTQDGTKDITEVFGEKAFGFPKPLSLIKYLLKIATPRAKKLSILDFFAGSGTTLHATMQLNAEDGGHRQCILVTNNENQICEQVTYERNKRVIQGYTTPKGQAVEGLGSNNLRYYKIDYTNRAHTHENRMALAQAMTELLQIKNSAYETPKLFGHLKVKPRYMRYFRGDKDVLVVYFPEIIPHLENEIKAMSFKDKLQVYVAIDGNYPFADEFAPVATKVEVVAIPSVYYYALKHVLPDASGEPTPDDTPNDEDAELLSEANKNDYQD
jgi:adenine-specific DNA-methyltransferase